MASSGNETASCRMRVLDITSEPQKMLMPIRGYEKVALVSLEEAVKPLVPILPEIHDYAYVAKTRCEDQPCDGLTRDETASIMLYTMNWEPLEECLYVVLNATLRTEDRGKLKPWFSYLKLLLTALSQLPSTRRFIYRGANVDLSKQYLEGKTIIWWAFSSCTSSIKVLENEQFLGKTGVRTIFTIDCHTGKDISRHSYFQQEQEILLLAARQFKVVASLQPASGLHMIQLEEIESSVDLLKPVTSFKPSPGVEMNKIVTPVVQDKVNLDKLKVTIGNNANEYNVRQVPIEKSPSKQTANPNLQRNSELEQKIEQSTPRSKVDLDKMKLNDRDIDIVVKLAIDNKQCTGLLLRYNEMTSVGASILAEALNNNNNLERLLLGWNRVSDLGVASLAKSLTNNNHTLTDLGLDSNGMTDSGCEHLAQMLKTNQTLTHLLLDRNEISDRGVRVLCEAIKHHNNSLRYLSLSLNKLLTDLSVDSLCDIIKHHRSLNQLWVDDCNLSSTGKQRLQKAKKSKKNFYLSV